MAIDGIHSLRQLTDKLLEKFKRGKRFQMFIFNNTRQEKGPCDILALRPFFYCATTLGLASTLAWSEGVTPTALSLRQNDATVNATGAAFKSNVSINSITLGEKVLQLKGADFHAPVAVKCTFNPTWILVNLRP